MYVLKSEKYIMIQHYAFQTNVKVLLSLKLYFTTDRTEPFSAYQATWIGP